MVAGQSPAMASDSVYVNRYGDLKIALESHAGYKTLDLWDTGVANQIAYDISTFEGEHISGVVDNVTRHVIVHSGDGADTIILSGIQVPGNVVIKTGNGDDNIVVSHSSLLGRFVAVAGGGDDFVSIDNSTLYGKTVIRTNGGHDEAFITNSSFEGNTIFKLGGRLR